MVRGRNFCGLSTGGRSWGVTLGVSLMTPVGLVGCGEGPAVPIAESFGPVLRVAEVHWRVVSTSAIPLDSSTVIVRFPAERGEFVAIPVVTDAVGTARTFAYQLREESNLSRPPVDTISVWAVVSVDKAAYRLGDTPFLDSTALVLRMAQAAAVVPVTYTLPVRAPAPAGVSTRQTTDHR